MRVAVLVLVAVVLVTGAVGYRIFRGGEAGAIPWKDERFVWTPPVPDRPAQPGPPCRARDLRVFWHGDPGHVFQPATGSAFGNVTLAVRGPRPCRLTGRPGVVLEPGNGQRAVQRPFPAAMAADVARSRQPDYTLLALPPGGRADLHMEWSNWCGPGVRPTETGEPPTALRVTVPGGGSIRVGMTSAAPTCFEPQGPTDLLVDRFRPEAQLNPPDEPNYPVSIHVTAPREVHRGELIAYQVTLTNFTRLPVRFDRGRCPTYGQGLQGQVWVLNCRPAGRLDRGESATFDMRYRIPGHAPLGLQPLEWDLSPNGSFIKTEQAEIRVLP